MELEPTACHVDRALQELESSDRNGDGLVRDDHPPSELAGVSEAARAVFDFIDYVNYDSMVNAYGVLSRGDTLVRGGLDGALRPAHRTAGRVLSAEARRLGGADLRRRLTQPTEDAVARDLREIVLRGRERQLLPRDELAALRAVHDAGEHLLDRIAAVSEVLEPHRYVGTSVTVDRLRAELTKHPLEASIVDTVLAERSRLVDADIQHRILFIAKRARELAQIARIRACAAQGRDPTLKKNAAE